MKRFLKIVIITFITPFFLYEGYYQINAYWKTRGTRNAAAPTITSSTYVDQGHYWTYPKEHTFVMPNEEGEKIEIKSDKFGFRNTVIHTENDILLIGDSFTSAANTKDDLTLAHHLTTAGYKVYNAGIDGTGTIHQSYILRDILHKIASPKVVVLNFYLGNDFRDNFFCGDVPKIIIEKPVGEVAIKTMLMQKKEDWIDKAKYKMKSKFINALNHFGTFQLIYQKFYLPAKLENDMGFYDRSEMKLMAHANHQDKDIERAIQKTSEALRYMKAILQDKNIKLIVVGIPSKAQVLKSAREINNFANDPLAASFFQGLQQHIQFETPNKILAELCEKEAIPYVALLPVFRSNLDKKLYYHFDDHWTYIGQKIAADALMPILTQQLTVIGTP